MDISTTSTLDRARENGEIWLSKPEAAAYMGCSTRTINRLVESEGLPMHRLGSTQQSPLRFAQREIDAWLRSRCSDSSARSEAAG